MPKRLCGARMAVLRKLLLRLKYLSGRVDAAHVAPHWGGGREAIPLIQGGSPPGPCRLLAVRGARDLMHRAGRPWQCPQALRAQCNVYGACLYRRELHARQKPWTGLAFR